MSNQGIINKKEEMSYNKKYLKMNNKNKFLFEGGFKCKLIYKN